MNINKFIIENRLIRRILVGVITFIFLKVTLNIFDGAELDAFKVTAYGVFAGIFTLIIKFYLQSGKNEAEGD